MMQALRFGFVTGPILGITWMFIIVLTVAVAMSFATGQAFAPDLTWSMIWGVAAGFALILRRISECWRDSYFLYLLYQFFRTAR